LALVRARAARVKQALFRGAEMLRKYVEHLEIDRPLYNDHNAMKKLVKSGEILEEVEKAVGSWDKKHKTDESRSCVSYLILCAMQQALTKLPRKRIT
jgi:hypothetical protein